jgi:D-glycero-D-manno-heptose 1,7-bisphosphate phosphatase
VRQAVFFDRDGTLIVDHGYISSPDLVELLPGIAEVLKEIRKLGFLLVIVSNQSGIGRELITESQAAAVSTRFREILAEEGVQLDGTYQCPHAPDAGCSCRKPEPGMLRKAAMDLGIDLKSSYMVGDKFSDAEAGEAAGCCPVLLLEAGLSTRKKVPDSWLIIRNLSEFLNFVRDRETADSRT